jgi:hypothetical protein
LPAIQKTEISGPDRDPLQILVAPAINNANTEIDVTENSLPICIGGSDGQGA